MNNIMKIFKKEFRSYFNSPVAYISLFVFLILAGYFFTSPMFLENNASLRVLFSIVPLIYIFFIPATTMSLISREKDLGTLEILTTFPLSDYEIIMGKFLSSIAVLGVGLIFTLVHFFTIFIIGENVDFGAIICGYAGLFLLGAAYSAIGIFASSITENQIIAFIISLLIILFLWVIDFLLIFIPTGLVEFFRYLSSTYHMSNLTKGILDSRDLIYFGSIMFIFIKLAIVTMESRKWK